MGVFVQVCWAGAGAGAGAGAEAEAEARRDMKKVNKKTSKVKKSFLKKRKITKTIFLNFFFFLIACDP